MNLSELLVIETGPGLAGPMVTCTLSDFGASVLKIESAMKVDFLKARVPPTGKTVQDALEAPSVLEMSGGKRSVTLNLKTPEGRELFLGLIEQADVYVESFAPGWLERLGLSLERFLEINPRLVILSQSAYGSDGPLSDQRAYAPLMTALAGVESTIGYADGRVVPQVSTAFGDMVAGYFGNLLVMAALYQRERTGQGAIIDMSQTEASAAMAGVAYAEYGITGRVPGPTGNADPYASPHGVYRTRGDDDWVALATWSDEEWWRLCGALSIPDEVRDRYATAKERLASVGEVDALVEARTVLEPRDELYPRLQALGIACTPVLSTEEVEDFPALVERDLWTVLVHPRLGALRMTAIPWGFDHRDLARATWAEQIGTSTDAVLADLLDAGPEDLERWRGAGALD